MVEIGETTGMSREEELDMVLGVPAQVGELVAPSTLIAIPVEEVRDDLSEGDMAAVLQAAQNEGYYELAA